jgi:hypothetical protein
MSTCRGMIGGGAYSTFDADQEHERFLERKTENDEHYKNVKRKLMAERFKNDPVKFKEVMDRLLVDDPFERFSGAKKKGKKASKKKKHKKKGQKPSKKKGKKASKHSKKLGGGSRKKRANQTEKNKKPRRSRSRGKKAGYKSLPHGPVGRTNPYPF